MEEGCEGKGWRIGAGEEFLTLRAHYTPLLKKHLGGGGGGGKPVFGVLGNPRVSTPK